MARARIPLALGVVATIAAVNLSNIGSLVNHFQKHVERHMKRTAQKDEDFRLLDVEAKIIKEEAVAGTICQFSGLNVSHIPTIYVHGGPAKTGTTSIQDYFSCHQVDQLRLHNITFLGKVNPRDVKNCQGVPKDVVRPLVQYKKSAPILGALKEQIVAGNDVIISDEDLKGSLDLLAEVFRELEISMISSGKCYRIVPVAAYRRYHQWMVSLYEFSNKPKWYDRAAWEHWEGYNPPTFPEFFQQHYPSENKHPTAELLKGFNDAIFRGLLHRSNSSHAIDPRETASTAGHLCSPYILNMHMHQSDVVHDFRALVLQNRGITLTRSAPTEASNVNNGDRFAVDAEILALQLKRAGNLHESLRRRAVVALLHSKMELLYHNSTPPLDCINATQESDFLEAATVVEEALLPTEFHTSPQGIEALKYNFEQAGRKKRFCSVAFDKMLQQGDSSWKPFLNCLHDGEPECA